MRIERTDGVALLHLDAGKANAISPAFLRALDGLLAEAEASDARAIVLTGAGTSFSAGLALPQLIELQRDELSAFIEEFARVMLRVWELRQPVVAAINGHAIAGGCVLALQADVRYMSDGPYKIGLNEVALGIGLPAVVVETLRCQVPPATLQPVAIEGRLLPPREALALGLVHEVVPAAALVERALGKARALAALPAQAVQQVKAAVRAGVADRVRAAGAEDTRRWVDTWWSAEGQERLRAAVARLKK